MAVLELTDILAGLPAEERRRIPAVLDLLDRQACVSARLQGRVETLRKADDSPVTIVDLLHQTQMQQLVARRFPGDGMLGEEPRALQRRLLERAATLSREEYGLALRPEIPELPEQGERVWILDPIDGTKGFVGGRCFAIAVGYFLRDRPFFAAMAVPGAEKERPLRVHRSLAFAVAGAGAWRRGIGRPGDAWSTMRPASVTADGTLRVAVSLAHGGPMAERIKAAPRISVIEIDSQAKYLAVATGEIDAYVRAARDDGQPDVIWDHMPGGVVAREAGCVVEHFEGGDVVFEPRREIRFRGGMVCVGDPGSEHVRRALEEVLI